MKLVALGIQVVAERVTLPSQALRVAPKCHALLPRHARLRQRVAEGLASDLQLVRLGVELSLGESECPLLLLQQDRTSL